MGYGKEGSFGISLTRGPPAATGGSSRYLGVTVSAKPFQSELSPNGTDLPPFLICYAVSYNEYVFRGSDFCV